MKCPNHPTYTNRCSCAAFSLPHRPSTARTSKPPKPPRLALVAPSAVHLYEGTVAVEAVVTSITATTGRTPLLLMSTRGTHLHYHPSSRVAVEYLQCRHRGGYPLHPVGSITGTVLLQDKVSTVSILLRRRTDIMEVHRPHQGMAIMGAIKAMVRLRLRTGDMVARDRDWCRTIRADLPAWRSRVRLFSDICTLRHGGSRVANDKRRCWTSCWKNKDIDRTK